LLKKLQGDVVVK